MLLSMCNEVKVKNFLFILFTFFMLCLNTQATTWIKIDDNEYIDKDNISYYVNDYSQMNFNAKIFWYKYDNNNNKLFKDLEKDAKRKISYALLQYIIDTNQKKIATKSIIFYDKQGDSVLNYTYKDFELDWDTIVPNSKADLWYELVKKPKYLKKLYKLQLIKNGQ